jgi:hypothetical protein
VLAVLEGALELDDVGLAAEVLQDGDLPSHVLDVRRRGAPACSWPRTCTRT